MCIRDSATGVRSPEPAPPPLADTTDGGVLSVGCEPEELYFFGIIDITTLWNSRKQAERALKGASCDAMRAAKASARPARARARSPRARRRRAPRAGLMHDRRQISAVPPSEYAERFIRFLEKTIV